MKRFKMNRLIFLVVLIGVLISGCTKPVDTADVVEENYIPVEVEAAELGKIENEFKVNGKIVANEEVAVIPKAMGIVTNVNVELGDSVKAGQVLFTIEQEDISKTVRQAESSVKVASNGVSQAENGLKTAQLNYELNKEQIENAQTNLRRMEELYEAGSISKSDLEQARLAASNTSLETVKTQITQAEIGYEQALNQLEQAQIGYEQALSNLGNTTVTAPIDGVVSSLNVKRGQMVTNSQAAATIVDLETIYVQVNVVENMINNLAVGQEVKVRIPSIAEEDIASTIYYISQTAEQGSSLYPVKIYIDNLNNKIRPGMNSQVLLGTGKVEGAVIIKSHAILDKDGEDVVFTVEDDKAVKHVIETGIDSGDYTEIKSGITSGQEVIVEGQHYVDEGSKVKVVRGE